MTEPSPLPEFFKAIQEPLAAAGAVQRVFGAPIQSGERTILPVARVAWGFGGGSGRGRGPMRHAGEAEGSRPLPEGEGGGGGGGIQIRPLGVFEITPEGTRFIPPSLTSRMVAALAGGLLVGWFLGRRL